MMDELAEALSGFGVSRTVNDPSAPHPRYSQYKQRSGPDQRERRRRMLEQQKDRRFNAKAHIRALTDNVWDEVGEDGEDMEVDQHKHPGRYYRDQLMLSEWMVEVPDRFDQDWMMVACPVGKRCLVLAGSGYSSAYGKNGHHLFSNFQSLLPGGSTKHGTRSDLTILDCIYSAITRTFYILDMMCWNDMEVYNSDLEFRLFWLHAKINECAEDLTATNKHNHFRFVPLTFKPCDDATIVKTLQEWEPHELDGLLFYHKQVHYLFGANPLCLWLQAYMVPDLLHLAVPSQHLQRAPQNYVNFEHHTQQVKEKKAQREEKERQYQEKRQKQRRKKRGQGDGQDTLEEGIDDPLDTPEIEGTQGQSEMEGASEISQDTVHDGKSQNGQNEEMQSEHLTGEGS